MKRTKSELVLRSALFMAGGVSLLPASQGGSVFDADQILPVSLPGFADVTSQRAPLN